MSDENLNMLDNIRWNCYQSINWRDGFIDPDGTAMKQFKEDVDSPFIRFPVRVTDPDELSLLKQRSMALLFTSEFISMYYGFRDSITESETFEKPKIVTIRLNTLIGFIIFLIILYSLYMWLNITRGC